MALLVAAVLCLAATMAAARSAKKADTINVLHTGAAVLGPLEPYPCTDDKRGALWLNSDDDLMYCTKAGWKDANKAPTQVPTGTGQTCNSMRRGMLWLDDADLLQVCNGVEWQLTGCVPGPDGTENDPAISCKQLIQDHPNTPTGAYWIQPDGSANKYQTRCDMDVDGGGWTLVMQTRYGSGSGSACVTGAQNLPTLATDAAYETWITYTSKLTDADINIIWGDDNEHEMMSKGHDAYASFGNGRSASFNYGMHMAFSSSFSWNSTPRNSGGSSSISRQPNNFMGGYSGNTITGDYAYSTSCVASMMGGGGGGSSYYIIVSGSSTDGGRGTWGGSLGNSGKQAARYFVR